MRQRNYFVGAVKGDENNVTELLANLMRHRYMRTVILEQLGLERDVIDRVAYEHISTQVSVKGVGQPDLVVECPDLLLMFVEVKTKSETRVEKNQIN